MPHRQVSTTHSTRTFTVSRDRQKPASSIVKTTCMPKTRKAATSVQAVFTGFTTSEAFTMGASSAKTWPKKTYVMAAMTSRTAATPITFPASRVVPYFRHSDCPRRTFNRDSFSEKDSLLPPCNFADIPSLLLIERYRAQRSQSRVRLPHRREPAHPSTTAVAATGGDSLRPEGESRPCATCEITSLSSSVTNSRPTLLVAASPGLPRRAKTGAQTAWRAWRATARPRAPAPVG